MQMVWLELDWIRLDIKEMVPILQLATFRALNNSKQSNLFLHFLRKKTFCQGLSASWGHLNVVHFYRLFLTILKSSRSHAWFIWKSKHEIPRNVFTVVISVLFLAIWRGFWPKLHPHTQSVLFYFYLELLC